MTHEAEQWTGEWDSGREADEKPRVKVLAVEGDVVRVELPKPRVTGFTQMLRRLSDELRKT